MSWEERQSLEVQIAELLQTDGLETKFIQLSDYILYCVLLQEHLEERY